LREHTDMTWWLELLLLGTHGFLNAGSAQLRGLEATQSLGGEFEGTLFLSNTHKLLNAPLHGGHTDKVRDECLHSAELLLWQRLACLLGDRARALGGLVAVVEASDDAVASRSLPRLVALGGDHPVRS